MLFENYDALQAPFRVTLTGEEWELMSIALEYACFHVRRKKDKELSEEFLNLRQRIHVELGVEPEELSVGKKSETPTRRDPFPTPPTPRLAKNNNLAETQAFDGAGEWAREFMRKQERRQSVGRKGPCPRRKSKALQRVIT